MPRIPVRYLSVLTLFPLLLLSQAAEAARISFATKDCGTPPLLGLEFTVIDVEIDGDAVLSATTDECPTEAVGSLVGDGGVPLYGLTVESIMIASDAFASLTSVELDPDSELSAQLTLDGNILTVLFDAAIPLICDFSTEFDTLACLPLDLAIGAGDFAQNTHFRVIAVDELTVPEPGTLALLGIGVAAAAVRRRRRTTGER